MTIQLKGPYRTIMYHRYRPAKGEAYRPLQGVKVDPKLIEETQKKWEDKLFEVGVKLKRSDKGKDSRRYQYRKDQLSVCCIGIQMKEIKKAVKKYDLSDFLCRNKWLNEFRGRSFFVPGSLKTSLQQGAILF